MSLSSQDWLEAQNGVLGSALIEPKLVPMVLSETSAEDYSGTSLALIYSMNALYSVDPEGWYELRIKYPAYLDADMRAQNEYVDSHDTKVAEVSDKVNDTYLKFNDQQDGVRSYGKMVDLLLAYRRSL